MFYLVLLLHLHCEMPGEKKEKKKTPYPLEGKLGMLGAPGYVATPLTYASVDESVWSYSIRVPEVGTKCQE